MTPDRKPRLARPRLAPLTFDGTVGVLARSGHIPLAPYLQLQKLADKTGPAKFSIGASKIRKEIIIAIMVYKRSRWWPLPALRSPWLREYAISFLEEIERANSMRIELLCLQVSCFIMRQHGISWQDLTSEIKNGAQSEERKTQRCKTRKRRSMKERRLERQLLKKEPEKHKLEKKLELKKAKAEMRKTLAIFIEGIAIGYFPGVVSPSAGLLPAVAAPAVAETNPLIVIKKSCFCEWCCAYHV